MTCALLATPALAQDQSESFAIHAQSTFVLQYHPAFHSPYRGPNSLDPGSRGDETFDATLYLGARLWQGGEVWIDPEIDQGFGLSGTFGIAAFPSGEAYKVGSASPYVRIPSLFFRQVFDLGGESAALESEAKQLAGARDTNNLIITAGKFSVVDIFDTNDFAHDARADFMNWAIIDSGAFDYAADAWGYTYGIAAELNQSQVSLRAGIFDMSRVPNGPALVRGFGYYELLGEAEFRYDLFSLPGSIKLLAFDNRARMGSYDDALRLAAITGGPPSTALVRRYASRDGLALNLQQAVGEQFGFFLRASANDGSKENYEFTDINRSVAAGISVRGVNWGRPEDKFGIAAVESFLSRPARQYFAVGGLGTLIGDGRLPHYAPEQVIETFYSAALPYGLSITADYQFVSRPAYNRDRGPVSIVGLRLHYEI
jgi:high affinity Mn2+ porin